MSELQSAEFQFGETGEETLRDYRSVNCTSVVGLVLGLLSAASLLHWLLLPIALAAVLVSCLALLQIRARSGELLGRKAALAGITLGIFFAAFATTREYLRRGELDRQARRHADHWLDLIRDGGRPNLYKAFGLRKPYLERQPAGTDLALGNSHPNDFQTPDSGTEDGPPRQLEEYLEGFSNFLNEPVIKTILEAGIDSDLTFIRVVGRNQPGDAVSVTLEYLLRYQKDKQLKTARFSVKVSRNYYDDIGEAHWHIEDVQELQL